MTDLFAEALLTFRELLDEARAGGDREPTAMTLATVDDDGRVSARVVLLKAFDERGFVFYTNFDSRKGRELSAHPQAALLFHWKLLRDQVQVRIEAFNALNWVNLGTPNTTQTSPNFGRITALASGMSPRVMQGALRVSF